MSKKLYFPIFMDLSKKRIVVVGGGNIAARRVETLLPFAEDISVVSPTLSDTLKDMYDNGSISWSCKEYCSKDIINADLVLAATCDVKCNENIAADCKEMGIPVNVSHKKELCDFYFPAVAKGEYLVAGITASGVCHVQAKRFREAVTPVISQLENEAARTDFLKYFKEG